MFEGYAFYAVITVLIGVVTILSVVRDFQWRRSIAVACFLPIPFLAFVSVVDLLSRPRPAELMLAFQRPNPPKATVLASHMKEGEYIMVLLIWDGLDYPRYFQFPWNKEMAEQMQSAQNEAKRKGSPGIELLFPFEDSLDRREKPYAHPIPIPDMMLPKPDQPPEVKKFEHPSQGI